MFSTCLLYFKTETLIEEKEIQAFLPGLLLKPLIHVDHHDLNFFSTFLASFL
jgi:hypothetical protein